MSVGDPMVNIHRGAKVIAERFDIKDYLNDLAVIKATLLEVLETGDKDLLLSTCEDIGKLKGKMIKED